MKDASDFRIKLDIRHSPEPANGDSAIWARAQVYAVLGDGTNVAVYQHVIFQIEDAGEGQSNAVFERTRTKEASADSNATTGWTPWQYFTSKQAGSGTMQAYLTGHKDISDTKGFSFTPIPSAGKIVLRMYGEPRFWIPSSVLDMLHGLVTAWAADTSDPGTRFILEPVGGDSNTVRIWHCDSGCYVGRAIEGNALFEKMLFAGGPGRIDTFTINRVGGSDNMVTLQVDGWYVYASWNATAGNYNLFVDGTSADDPMAHFAIIDMPS
jgi:hypothetical protein